MKTIAVAVLFVLFIVTGCSRSNSFEIRLENAVKERKLTKLKSKKIIAELDSLDEVNEAQAFAYKKRIVAILDVGGDSSHVDVIRRQVFNQKPVKD